MNFLLKFVWVNLTGLANNDNYNDDNANNIN